MRPPEEPGFYTYMLRCRDGSLYIGWTNRLDRRLKAHNAGTGGKYTRAKRPVELVYFEVSASKEAAMSREWHLKQLTHEQKEKLIAAAYTENSEESGKA